MSHSRCFRKLAAIACIPNGIRSRSAPYALLAFFTFGVGTGAIASCAGDITTQDAPHQPAQADIDLALAKRAFEVGDLPRCLELTEEIIGSLSFVPHQADLLVAAISLKIHALSGLDDFEGLQALRAIIDASTPAYGLDEISVCQLLEELGNAAFHRDRLHEARQLYNSAIARGARESSHAFLVRRISEIDARKTRTLSLGITSTDDPASTRVGIYDGFHGYEVTPDIDGRAQIPVYDLTGGGQFYAYANTPGRDLTIWLLSASTDDNDPAVVSAQALDCGELARCGAIVVVSAVATDGGVELPTYGITSTHDQPAYTATDGRLTVQLIPYGEGIHRAIVPPGDWQVNANGNLVASATIASGLSALIIHQSDALHPD